ncbi:M23 family metallopeptidase [Microbacterium testaceum]|uniref:M23 family metallopeptidase n=1 Tax=Microbacterium testaceum TaxID=2033 RepID=UPI00128EB3EE|nr:M23 family metallopeptidase [Microbacterium testaceum]
MNDVAGWIRDIFYRLRKLESGAFLENSSVTNGRLRFIGGLLLIDSGGTLQVVGHLSGDGDFVWSGPWAFTGAGEITGNVDLTGNLDVVDSGKITVGNIRIEGGKIYVGTGSAQIVIDGATGKITAGNMTMDPTTSGGALTFQNGAQVFTDTDTIQLYKGNSVVQVSEDYARLQNGGDVVEIDGDGVRISPGGIPTALDTDGLQWLAIEVATGRIKRVPPGVGGPGTGDFDWPFPISTKTYGFRPPDRPTHDGVDLAGPDVTGHDIPAAGRGVVTFAGGNATTGYGYYVIVNHGQIDGVDVETLYGHMATLPTVSVGQTVAKGALLGPVGNTGNSFGDHLHFEVHLDGDPVDPEPWMAAHGA